MMKGSPSKTTAKKRNKSKYEAYERSDAHKSLVTLENNKKETRENLKFMRQNR
jgi:hypothetical protein